GAARVHVWDPSTGKEVLTLDTQPNVQALALAAHWLSVSANGQRVAAIGCEKAGTGALASELPAGLSQRLSVWNTANGALVGEIRNFRPYGAALGPDGKFVAAFGFHITEQRYGLRVWDTRTGRETARLKDPRPLTSTSIVTLAFSPDGKRLAVGASRGT